MGKNELREIKEQITEFQNMFKDNPVKEIKEGTWLAKILKIAFNENSEKLSAKYFKKKYVGLNNEQKAERLIKTTSKYTAIIGGIAASTASAAELSTIITSGWSLTAFAASIIGEISSITYLQLKMVYEISILLEARLDINDPEDILSIFWLGLGLNIWEDISNTVMKMGIKSTEYIGKKALKSGISKAVEEMTVNIGGRKLAQKISEKTFLKLIVPGINIPAALWLNKKFTERLGEIAINKFKRRGAVIYIIEELLKNERYYSIISIPLIYHIGIFENNDAKGLSRVIEVQSNAARKLVITEEDEALIESLVSMSSPDFFDVLKDIKNPETAKLLLDLSICTLLISGKEDHTSLESVCKALNINYLSLKMEDYQEHLGQLK